MPKEACSEDLGPPSQAWAEPPPITGDLESFKKQSFVLKEGVEYRIKISFRVRPRLLGGHQEREPGNLTDL